MEMQAIALAVNPGSRRGAGVAEQVAALLSAHHTRPEVTTYDLGSGEGVAAVLDRAVATGPDLLVVGGGDGTVGCAAGAVAGTPTVLGVLPLGTANDFARTLEIPGDLSGAIATLVEGKVVDVDLGRVDGRPFLNVASLGFSVAATQKLSARLKRVIGPLAYPVATARAYRSLRPFAGALEFPDGDHPTVQLADLLQISIGNGRHYGGGNTIAPHASLDDHALDVAVVERGRLSDHVSIARFLKDGSFVEHERVHHRSTRCVRVITDEPMPVNLDGEIVATTPIEVSVQRNAVRVLVPEHSTAATLDGTEEQLPQSFSTGA